LLMISSEKTADLEAAVRRFGEAWANGDLVTLEGLLSPTYTHIDYYGGYHERVSWLEYASRRTRLKTQIHFREVHTRVVGNVAIVTGINDIEYVGDTETDSEKTTVQFTQVWVWQTGYWLREAFQATAVRSE